jgi:hypothetical protein
MPTGNPDSLPATFKGWPIVAAVRLPEDPTLKPMRHVIVAEHPHLDPAPNRYSVHTIGWDFDMWTAGEGKYGLAWADAIRRMAEDATGAPGSGTERSPA